MPKSFDKILDGVKKSLKGKINPRTKKPYAESDLYAIAVTQFKKKFGHAPSKEQSPSWYCENGKEIRTNVNLNWSEAIEYDKDVYGNNPLKISGRAINETVTSNGIKYVAEELEKAAPSLIGKPLLNSHQRYDVKEVLGKVIAASKEDGFVSFEAEIDPNERKVTDKVRKGYINKVSIGARVKELVREESDNTDCYLAKGIDFKELSLVTVPGDDGAEFGLTHALCESFSADETNMVFDENPMEEKNKMSDEKIKELNKKVESLEMDNSKLADKIKEFETKNAESKEAEKLAEFKASIKKELLEELKVVEDEEKEDKEEEDKEDEDKKDENKDSEEDGTKGIIDTSSKVSNDDKTKVAEISRKMVIEKDRFGVSFYYLTGGDE